MFLINTSYVLHWKTYIQRYNDIYNLLGHFFRDGKFYVLECHTLTHASLGWKKDNWVLNLMNIVLKNDLELDERKNMSIYWHQIEDSIFRPGLPLPGL